ncbi:unnamed protein product [Arctia plantaginis]|uniref:Glucose-1-phosphatase n=1 Tax=Arctia plantaginis TaxID=874455 RepID=A0A8S0ZM10_ARCPL|nr:unnamed protein product [Arctia plantaginis]
MALILFIFCVIALCKGNKLKGLTLEQVLVLSRHNIRTPLTTNLDIYSPNKWPKFNETDANLTQRGVLMESFMAEYFAEWLASEDFIKGCPGQEEVLIYPNTLSRTRGTAKSFADAAFPSCSIYQDKHSQDNRDVFDPLFHSLFQNTSENFIEQIKNEMKNTLNEVDLTESYLELNRILDIKNSDICKQKNVCDLSKNSTQIVYEEGKEPEVQGPLLIGNQVIDTFIMSFYEGFPLENVAWGKVTSEDQWEILTRIIKHNINVRLGPLASKDIGKPLLKYMFNIFKSRNPKFTMIVGHDTNICVILKALDFKNVNVVNQYEPYPIGGKLVFQKWSNGADRFLKVEYVYPTFSQLRNSEKLSLTHPPQKVLLELKDCKINDSGFCPWDDFIKLND